MTTSEFYMLEALKEAIKTTSYGDVPIGCVIVKDRIIIGRGYNQVEKCGNSLAHSEIIAINEAIKNINYKHLLDCELYTTLEPCPMCAGAIVSARIKKLVYGASDPKSGYCGSLHNTVLDERLNHNCIIEKGVLEKECSDLLKDFFKKLRIEKNEKR